MIPQGNRRNIYFLILLCLDPIDSACGSNRWLERIGPSHCPCRTHFVAEITNLFGVLEPGAARTRPGKRRKIHFFLTLRCASIAAACGHDDSSVEAWTYEVND
jgi:hypothetical protein